MRPTISALGLTVVAEGVETEGQNAFLSGSRCDELQGYLFSKPVPADATGALFLDRADAPPLQPALQFAAFGQAAGSGGRIAGWNGVRSIAPSA